MSSKWVEWGSGVEWDDSVIWGFFDSEYVFRLVPNTAKFYFLNTEFAKFYFIAQGEKMLFEREKIEINASTDLWGPFLFNFPVNSSTTSNDGVLPYGTTISNVSVKAYLNSIDATDTLSEETEITDLIESGYTSISGESISLRLQYPVAVNYKGYEATLVFDLTLDGGQEQAFFFQFIDIQ